MRENQWRTLIRCKPLLGTYVEITAHTYSDHPIAYRDLKYCIERAFSSIQDLHLRLNFYNENSELSHLNRLAHLGPLVISSELKTLLLIAHEIHCYSEGLFNCGIGQCALRLDKDQLRFGDLADLQFLAHDHVYANRPLCLNLSGIAKGYAVDCAVDILLKQGVAAGCVNAGGDLKVFGPKAQKIHLRIPHQSHALIELGELQNGAVASSANYFCSPTSTQNLGQGIVHPQQQLPSDSPHSYSIIAPQCVHADALTKVLALSQQIVHPCFERYDAKPFIFYHDKNTYSKQRGD
jgi:thiamine biosynthesis lipoprotein